VRSDKNQRFAALPLRALLDPRLGRLHLRTLGIICAFDRLGKNGGGCWASQNKIAGLARVDKAQLSRILSGLREFGYISSKLNPSNRWFRVHSVIYTDADADFWKPKSVAPRDNRFDKAVVKTEPISCAPEQNQLVEVSENTGEINEVQNVTIVPTKTQIIGETASGAKGPDCAEARSRLTPSDDEEYLIEVEALAASNQQAFALERPRLEQIVSDPCLPEELNERAARLLSLMPDKF
jgi:DNA-binding MarR family transcriptional regulator